MPKGSTAGKEKPGVTIGWEELRERLRAHKPYHRKPSRVHNFLNNCRGKMGSIVTRLTGCRLLG